MPDSKKPYLEWPILSTAFSRIKWLVILFIAERFTGTVLRHFGTELQQVVALAYFIPLLIGTGGNAGAQTTTTITRALALKEIDLKHIWIILGKEIIIGLCVGIVIGVVGLINALAWHSSIMLAITVGFAQTVIITWATAIGSMLPLLAKKCHVDPAVMTAPFVTTLVDATGLIFYFLLAKLLLGI